MEITTNMVKELRAATGAGVLECRNTLASTGGDFARALASLTEKGLKAAAKKAERTAQYGLIGHMQSDDGRLAVLVEVNCETDFVALTPAFRQIVGDLTQLVAIAGRGWQGTADLLAQVYPGDTRPVADVLRGEIVRFGENVVVRRFARFELAPDALNRRLSLYVHPGSLMAALVELEGDREAVLAHPEYAAFARDIAMQVVAARPAWVECGDIPAEALAAETARIREELAVLAKPEPVLARIVEGKLQKFYEEKCLLEQPFMRDDSLRVREVIAAAGQKFGSAARVVRFAHMAVGD
jgi:elongation factor Ts